MKFINKVIVFVMGVVVIGVVATAIGVATQPKTVEKSVTFELLENGELSYNVYDKIEEYAVFNGGYASNLVGIFVNGDNSDFTTPTISVSPNREYFDITDDNDDNPLISVNKDNTYSTSNVNVGDTITIIFEVDQETPVIIKTLIFLIPLVLSASLIGYLAFKKGEKL